MDIDRIIDAVKRPEDDFELTLRPQTLSQYIGQTHAKKNLSIFIQAAKLK